MPEFDSVKDSGVRQEFATGSRRDTQTGKGRFDLIPWLVMPRFARHYENGAEKYGDHNWIKGQPSSRYLSSAFRHLCHYAIGKRDEDHLAAAMWNIAAIMFNEEMVENGMYNEGMHDLIDFTDPARFHNAVYGGDAKSPESH